MNAEHYELLVEEPSMEAFLIEVLPKLIGIGPTFTIHPHQGKPDLLGKLGGRLRAYAKWLPASARIVIVVDRDGDDCVSLKQRLENMVREAGLSTRATSGAAAWRAANRIAVEELEAWYFGEWAAVHSAYPGVPRSIENKAAYRQPDAIVGGTWEAFERVLKQAGYFSGGLRKVEAARSIGRHLDPLRCRSPSFIIFCELFLCIRDR